VPVIGYIYNVMKERGVSRRDFNKIILAGGGFLAVNTLGLKLLLDKKSENSPLQEQTRRYQKEIKLYGREGSELISNIERNTGLIVSLPETLSVHDPLSGEIFNNTAWNLEELKSLDNASQKLPDKARETRKIAFGVIRSSSVSGIGGLSPEGQRFGLKLPSMILITPKDYSFQDQSSEPELWMSRTEEFDAVFNHEMVHLMVERNPHLLRTLSDYLGKEVWLRKGNGWEYSGGKSRVIDFMERKGLSNTKYWGPEEDVAFSSMLYVTNPRYLVEGSESDQKRFTFLSSEVYSGALYF
jgi:hypothetical protein